MCNQAAKEFAVMFEECVDAGLDMISHLPEQEAKDVVVKALCAVLCNVQMNGLGAGRTGDRLPGKPDLELAHRLMVALGYHNAGTN